MSELFEDLKMLSEEVVRLEEESKELRAKSDTW